MKQRIAAFDYLRVVAICGVLVCHFCHNYDSIAFMGHWCGTTFVTMFIVMSGVLLGMSWYDMDNPKYGVPFLKKRFFKLSRSYYPFLLIMFLFLWRVMDYPVSVRDIIMHLTYLCWFDKLPCFGHLYFLTVIVICYVATCVLSRFVKIIKISRRNVVVMNIVIGIIVFFTDFFLEKSGQPGYLFLWLWLFLLAFIYPLEFIQICKNVEIHLLLFLGVVINVCSLLMFYRGLFDFNHCVARWTGAICCVSMMAVVIRLFSVSGTNRIVSYIASISFEVYLMFNVISDGRYAVVKLFMNPIIGFIVYVIISFIFGGILHFLAYGIENENR